MKKIAFALVIAAVAASPAMAAKKSKKPAAEQTAWELNESGRRFVWDSMPVYWPSVAKMVVYSNAPAKK